MAMTDPPITVTVRIGAIALPAGSRPPDADDLRRRVEHELAGLLAREPLRTVPPADTRIELLAARVHASAAAPPSIAHAIARRIHTDMQTRERRP